MEISAGVRTLPHVLIPRNPFALCFPDRAGGPFSALYVIGAAPTLKFLCRAESLPIFTGQKLLSVCVENIQLSLFFYNMCCVCVESSCVYSCRLSLSICVVYELKLYSCHFPLIKAKGAVPSLQPSSVNHI
jgi:hypothetical protein